MQHSQQQDVLAAPAPAVVPQGFKLLQYVRSLNTGRIGKVVKIERRIVDVAFLDTGGVVELPEHQLEPVAV